MPSVRDSWQRATQSDTVAVAFSSTQPTEMNRSRNILGIAAIAVSKSAFFSIFAVPGAMLFAASWGVKES